VCRKVFEEKGRDGLSAFEGGKMKELVFEVGTEEMPPRFVPQALEVIKERFSKWLKEERIEGKEIKVFGTPRRLVILGLLEEYQSPLEVLKIGPPKKVAFDQNGHPTLQAQGFAKSQGVSVDELVVVSTEKGEYVAVKKSEEGKPTSELLKEFLPQLILNLPMPKSMRWEKRNLRFIRPIRWVLAVFGGEVLELEVFEASSYTFGHRFMAPQRIKINGIKDYLAQLREAYVLVDQGERRRRIREEIERVTTRVGGHPLIDEDLLEEVTFMVEYPWAILGGFEESFLRLPKEVLITAMQHHQRFFPVLNEKGQLMPYFVAISNTLAKDMEVVKRGNERVLKARLEDASFFYHEDLKIPLEERVPRLKEVVFHSELGTLYEKIERLITLSEKIALKVCPSKVELAKRAAFLCKADLLTEMVGEFPELQGIMGREYALRAGEKEEVAIAIEEHYKPRSSDDDLPQSETGSVLSLAEKLDNLCGFFSIGLSPSGTSDPFALRRQAIGLVMILLKRKWRLNLREAIEWAFELLKDKVKKPEAKEEVLEFILGRYEGILLSEGFLKDEINAIFEVQKEDLVDIKNRIQALHHFRAFSDFQNLVIAFKRVSNILKGISYPQRVDPNLFIQEEEKELYNTFLSISQEAQPLFEKEDYLGLLGLFVKMKDRIDRFFDKVLVMTDEKAIRENRLALLGNINNLFLRVADIAKLIA
jgi:glycyl-tRNA synthetase beta chain